MQTATQPLGAPGAGIATQPVQAPGTFPEVQPTGVGGGALGATLFSATPVNFLVLNTFDWVLMYC